MSIKPGATTSPRASITVGAVPPRSRPITAIRPCRIPRSPRNDGLPVPSTNLPFRIRMSNVCACSSVAAASRRKHFIPKLYAPIYAFLASQRRVRLSRMDVVGWLLDSDPAIRWQVLRDLVHAPAEEVAAERARVTTEGWGDRLLALQGAD